MECGNVFPNYFDRGTRHSGRGRYGAFELGSQSGIFGAEEVEGFLFCTLIIGGRIVAELKNAYVGLRFGV